MSQNNPGSSTFLSLSKEKHFPPLDHSIDILFSQNQKGSITMIKNHYLAFSGMRRKIPEMNRGSIFGVDVL